MRVLAAATLVVLAACGSDVGSSGPPRSASAAGLFLPACPVGARPQSDLDFAGIPPLVPTGPLLRCLRDRKSTRLNSSHQIISYAVFCLKKKKQSSTLRSLIRTIICAC